MGAVLVLLFSFGAFIFAISTELDSALTFIAVILAAVSVLFLLTKFIPKLAVLIIDLLGGLFFLYATGAQELIKYVLGALVLGLILWAIFTLGNRFGWWKEGFK